MCTYLLLIQICPPGSHFPSQLLSSIIAPHSTLKSLHITCVQAEENQEHDLSSCASWIKDHKVHLETIHIVGACFPLSLSVYTKFVDETSTITSLILEDFLEASNVEWPPDLIPPPTLPQNTHIQFNEADHVLCYARNLDKELALPPLVKYLHCHVEALIMQNIEQVEVCIFDCLYVVFNC